MQYSKECLTVKKKKPLKENMQVYKSASNITQFVYV